MRTATTSTLLLFLLAGCAPTAYQIGMKSAAEGQYYEASKVWLHALDDDIYQPKSRQALRDYADKAWKQRLDLAREHEASQRYAESVTTYEDALSFADNLSKLELLSFPTTDATLELADVRNKWADDEFAKGVADDQQGQWESAIAHFEKVRELRPTTPHLDHTEGLAYRIWAEDDLARHRYQPAADHFRKAFERTGQESSDQWAAAVEAALGRYALSKGFCRTAVGHFDLAQSALGDRNLQADTARAEDCARIGVVVEEITEDVAIPTEQTDLSSMLVDRIEREIDREGTRFVQLLSADVLPSVANPPSTMMKVSGRITQAVIDPPSTSKRVAVAEGEIEIECDKETQLYDPEAVCTELVEVEYQLHRTAQAVHLAGSVKLVELATGVKTTLPLEITLTEDTTHASSFSFVDGGERVEAVIGPNNNNGRVAVSAGLLALDRSAEPLPPTAESLADAIRLLAKEAGAAILNTVDHEDAPPPPQRLQVLKPTVLVEDVSFETPSVPPPPEMRAEPLGPVPATEIPPAEQQ